MHSPFIVEDAAFFAAEESRTLALRRESIVERQETLPREALLNDRAHSQNDKGDNEKRDGNGSTSPLSFVLGTARMGVGGGVHAQE